MVWRIARRPEVSEAVVRRHLRRRTFESPTAGPLYYGRRHRRETLPRTRTDDRTLLRSRPRAGNGLVTTRGAAAGSRAVSDNEIFARGRAG